PASRKVGTPLSADTPAPVSTSTRVRGPMGIEAASDMTPSLVSYGHYGVKLVRPSVPGGHREGPRRAVEGQAHGGRRVRARHLLERRAGEALVALEDDLAVLLDLPSPHVVLDVVGRVARELAVPRERAVLLELDRDGVAAVAARRAPLAGALQE